MTMSNSFHYNQRYCSYLYNYFGRFLGRSQANEIHAWSSISHTTLGEGDIWFVLILASFFPLQKDMISTQPHLRFLNIHYLFILKPKYTIYHLWDLEIPRLFELPF